MEVKQLLMEVIYFLCVPLGSSTVQLHDSLDSRCTCACSEAGFSSQNGDRALGVCYRRAEFYCAWPEGLNAKDIHKEMFPVSCWKCLSHIVIHNWFEKFSQGSSKVADDARPGAEMGETTDFYTACFDGTSVSMLVEDMSRNKCFFPHSKITCVYPFVTYLLTLLRISERSFK
jgi:hypothetical protein